MDARREAARRPSAPALALLVPWLLLALVAAFRDGGSSPMGLALAAVGAILASTVALALSSSLRLGLPRPSDCGSGRARGRGPLVRGGLRIARLVALAGGVLDRCDPRRLCDGGDRRRHVDRRAAPASRTGRLPGAGRGRRLGGLYSIAQRSFNAEFVAPSFPRLREPFGYANALAALLVCGVPTALVLGTRRELAARAAAAAAICVLVVALVLTGSRGGILATLVADPRRARAGGPAARARRNPRRGRRSRGARRALRRQPADLLGQRAPALGGAGLLVLLIARCSSPPPSGRSHRLVSPGSPARPADGCCAGSSWSPGRSCSPGSSSRPCAPAARSSSSRAPGIS